MPNLMAPSRQALPAGEYGMADHLRYPATAKTEGNRRATIRDVARMAKVSLGTVSRVINNNLTVRSVVRERVLAAMKELAYVPDPVAQSMRTQATKAIGFMVSDLANPLFSSIISAAEALLHTSGYSLIVANSWDQHDREKELLDLFCRRRLDGIIMTVSSEDNPATIQMIGQLKLPVVLIERELSVPLDSVSSDHYQGAFQATNYLLMLGHRRIGLVTVTRSALPGRARSLAFEAAHSDAGVPLDPKLAFYSGLTAEYGYNAAYEMLAGPQPPTAIIAGASQMVGVLKAVGALNIEVPGQLSLISLGDTDLAELYSPPLTAVRWDSKKIGTMAAQILLARQVGQLSSEPQKVVLPTEFVLRQSCAPPQLAAIPVVGDAADRRAN